MNTPASRTRTPPQSPRRRPLIVCLTGCESTGKTTLAKALARHHQAPLVEEAARGYLAGRETYAPDDLLAIAEEQLRLEEAALAEAGQLVVCDTDLLVIRIWWEVKYGAPPPALNTPTAQRGGRHYLLMAPDFPWVPDSLRETGGDRGALHRRYLSALKKEGLPFDELTGPVQQRLNKAVRRIDGLLRE